MSLQTSTQQNGHLPPTPTGLLAGPWTALDVAWLQFLKSHQASTSPLHDQLALWVSHQMGLGHACLDLDTLLPEPQQSVDWTEAAKTLPWAH